MQKQNNELVFPLFHEYANRWLVSRVCEHEVTAPPTAETEALNTVPKDRPGYTAFVAARRTQSTAAPEVLEPYPGGLVGSGADRSPFSIYWPFDDIGVTYAQDCETPSVLSAWAYTELWAETAEAVPFALITCGGAALWLNGEKAAEVTPYCLNTPASAPVMLSLRKGRNRVLVFFDNYAERDATIILRLRRQGGKTTIWQHIPTGAADPDRLLRAERLMGSLHFARDHFTAGPVRLCYAADALRVPLPLQITGGTEENLKGGVPYHCTAVLQPDRAEVSLGNCSDFPLGFLFLTASIEVDGVSLRRPISVEIHTQSVLPAQAPTVAGRKRQALELLARYGEQNTNRALALLATGGSTAEAKRLLAVQNSYIRRRFDCSDFYLVYYPYILRTFGSRGSGVLSEQTEREMTDCLLDFRYWSDEPGSDAMCFWTENHALMFHTCQLLAGELFPDRVFANSGLTGMQMQEKAKRLLMDWFAAFRAAGFTEWNSSPYLPIDTLGFGSLYAFSADPAMRALGKEGLDFACYLLAVHSQKGVFACSSGRTYIKEQFGNRSNCPSGFSWVLYGFGMPSHAGKGIVSVCLSDYEPPAEYRKWFAVPQGQELICQTTQGAGGYVTLYTYKTADFLMTSACHFRPGQPGYQENPFQLAFTADAQLWITHPGERALFGAARPSYWAGNGTLPQVDQYRAFAGLIYDIDPAHPVDFTHIYLPTAEFDECRLEPHWAFVRKGAAYAAVYCSGEPSLQTFGSNTDRECIAAGRRCIWLVRAAQADEFGSFTAFCDAMRNAPLTADAEQRRYAFDDPAYGQLACQWGAPLTVNGTLMIYGGQDRYGRLTMRGKA